jgi:hypothetical protein
MNKWEGRMKSETLHHGFIALALLVIYLAIVTAFLLPQTSFAADLYVSKNGTDSGNCIVNDCQTVAYAITKAGSGDRINIGPGIFYENLELDKNLSFYGAGMDTTILDGNSAGPVISNYSFALTVQDMTVRNGRSTGNRGGGIGHWGTSLNLTRVKVTGNSSPSGGGISSNAPLNMTDCVVSGNDASNTSGGGIILDGTGGTADFINVTISGNTSAVNGGGIHNQLAGTVNLTNVTITGNYALHGGAIFNTSGSVLNLTNSTIAHNSYYVGGDSAGVRNHATTNFKNTLMAGNGGANCFNGGTSYVTNSYGGNLDSGNTCEFTDPSDYPNTDPLLGPLGNNGGYVETMALLTGSLAIDSGANSGYPSTDARRTPRPQDGNSDGVPVCDIGAFERCPHKPAGMISPLFSFYYDSIGDAYAAVTGRTVISLQTYQFNENVNLSNDYSVTLNGGYDCDYGSNTGKFSILNGSLTVSQGTVTLANLQIK